VSRASSLGGVHMSPGHIYTQVQHVRSCCASHPEIRPIERALVALGSDTGAEYQQFLLPRPELYIQHSSGRRQARAVSVCWELYLENASHIRGSRSSHLVARVTTPVA
jgi:hypothetical protein